jgi:hypothetical protein
MRWWDGLLAVALIYTALVTPFEISFIPPDSSPLSYTFLCNRVLDGLFLLDMLLQFNLVHNEWQNRWVQTRREVTKMYLKGWFALDVASLAPSSADYIALANSEEGGSDGSTARIFRVIRVLRLLKLLRLLRPSRLLNRMLSRVAIPFRTLTMCKLTITIFLTTHWVACALGLVTTFSERQRLDTWLTAFGYCWPREAREGEEGVLLDPSTEIIWIRPQVPTSPHMVLTVAVCVDPASIYNACFEWGLSLITSMDVSMQSREPWDELALSALIVTRPPFFVTLDPCTALE